MINWEPPAGMDNSVAAGWRTFYRGIMDRYGMQPSQYRALYLAQQGRCLGCRITKGKHPDDPKGRGSTRLGVDHNHALGSGNPRAVRMLLCTVGDLSCNRIVGAVRDNPEVLFRLGAALMQPPAQRVFAELADMDKHGLSVDEQDAALLGMVTKP